MAYTKKYDPRTEKPRKIERINQRLQKQIKRQYASTSAINALKRYYNHSLTWNSHIFYMLLCGVSVEEICGMSHAEQLSWMYLFSEE